MVAKCKQINTFISFPYLPIITGYLPVVHKMVVFENLRPFFWWVVAIAAINWGFVGVFDFNLITDVITLSAQQTDIVYAVIGGIGLINIYNMAHEM